MRKDGISEYKPLNYYDFVANYYSMKPPNIKVPKFALISILYLIFPGHRSHARTHTFGGHLTRYTPVVSSRSCKEILIYYYIYGKRRKQKERNSLSCGVTYCILLFTFNNVMCIHTKP